MLNLQNIMIYLSRDKFATTETVSIFSPKRRFDNARTDEPLRKYTQVVISKGNSFVLSMNLSIRDSGFRKFCIDYNNWFQGKN